MEATVARYEYLAPHVLFPNVYFGVILFASLDVILTRVVLAAGGVEANPVAGAFIDQGGVWGMVLLKFAAVAMVLVVCEFIGRSRARLAHGLGVAALCLNAVPVVVAISLLARVAQV